jgi:hypothetical protein
MGPYDVIVAGGGTAGSVAAIAAAREGARVLCFDQFGALGGTSTLGLVMPLMSFKIGDRWLARGLNEEIITRLQAAPDDGDGIFHNPERLKFVLEDLALEAGVDLLYHTFLTGAAVDGGALRAVEVHNKSGRSVLEAAAFIDATGDADLALLAGAECLCGRPEDGLNQSASLRFAMAGVDWDALAAWLSERGVGAQPPRFGFGYVPGFQKQSWMDDLLARAEADGVLTADQGGYFQFFTVPGRPGEIMFNCPRILRINGSRAEDLTRAHIEGRRGVTALAEFCRRYVGGFERAWLAWTAPMVGIRESRRILGEYLFTGDDVMAAAKFPDAAARSNYPIDIHRPDRAGVILKHPPAGDWYEIPYRCMLPVRPDGLLVAGRCISSTFEGQSAMRIIPTVRALGEAAGVAAAWSARDTRAPRLLDAAALRRRWQDLGVLGDASDAA